MVVEKLRKKKVCPECKMDITHQGRYHCCNLLAGGERPLTAETYREALKMLRGEVYYDR